MKRFFILSVFLTAFVGCQPVESNVTDSKSEASGRESLKAIEFSIRDTAVTKGPTPITSLSEFNVSATTGSTGGEASKLSNVVFKEKSGVFKSDALWPSSDPGYHFYASNVAMTHNASGQSVTISSIDKDVVCAYLASPIYKVKNDLTFNHILARVGTVTFANLDLCSNVKLSMKYSGSGTYNLRTGAWSSVGSQSTKELTTADNDFWIIPGTYDATLTYNDANGNPQSKTLSQNFLAGKVNNISAKIDGSVVVKTEDEYEAPSFTLGTISDVPASGGDSGIPSVTAVGQRKRVKKTLADGTVKYDPDWTAVSSPDYTIQYGEDLSRLKDDCPSYHGNNLSTTAKERTKLGDVYVRVRIGDKTTDKNLTVYQAANARHKGQTAEKNHTRTGSVSYGSKEYYGGIKWGNKEYGSEYYKNTTTDSETQDDDTYGDWSTYSTSTDKYDYAVSFATTSWSPGAAATSKSNSVTASHNERDKYEQRRPVTHHYHTPYTDHYYKDWTRTGSRDYTRSASQKCNYIEYRTDTFDSGATEYVEENKSHTESWTDYGTDSNYDTDSGSDWTRDVSGSTSRTSDGGYDYQTTYGSGSKVTDYPTPTSSAGWLSYSGNTMSVSANSSTSTRYGTLSVSNGTASASCSVSQEKNQQTGSTTETETETQNTASNSGYWVKINGSTSSSVDVSADAGSVTVNVTAGHTHTVQPQIRTRTRTKYNWEVGDPTYSSWSSWSTWSDNGSPTSSEVSDGHSESVNYTAQKWLSANGSYSANSGSARSGTITAKNSSKTSVTAILTVNQAKKEEIVTLTSIEISVTKSPILAGQSTTYKVKATYSNGTTADVTASASISSSNSSMLSASGGNVQSNKKIGCLGTFTLTASYGGQTASKDVTVNTDYKSDDIKLSWSSDVGRSGEASSGTVSGYVKRNGDSQVTVSFSGNLKTSNNDTYSASKDLIEFYCDSRKASTSQTYWSQDGDGETYEMRYLGETIKTWNVRWDGQ